MGIEPLTISATERRYQPQQLQKTISATQKIHIGHRPYRPQNIMVSLLRLILSLCVRHGVTLCFV